MVGIPRSKGCLTCVSRRVKCDELRPECSKCTKTGRMCGGYNRPTKFVNAGSDSTKSRSKSNLSSSSSPGNPDSAIGACSIIQTALAKASPHAELLSPDHELAQMLSIFIASFSPLAPSVNSYGRSVSFTPWLSLIPSHLGKSTALDGAVACLSLHSIGSFSQNPTLVRESYQFYGKALCGLRRSLKSDNTVLASETLCATMVLSIYELFACTKESSWVQHAGGAGEMIRVRGPDRHMFGFERFMFNAFRGIILLESVVSEKPCFLELPEWKKIPMFADHDPAPVELLVEEFYQTATCLPRLRHEVSIICTGKKGKRPREKVITDLVELQIFLDNCVERLRTVSSQPQETLSSSGDDLFPFVYMFEHNSMASLFCHCASFSLMTRRALAELRVPGWDFQLLRNSLIDKICKTVEFATSKKAGVFGLFYITFSLRIAFGIAKDPVKSWIEERLANIAKVMPVAKVDPKDNWAGKDEVDSEEEVAMLRLGNIFI